MLQGRDLGPGPCGRKGGRQGQGTRDSPAGGWMSVAASLKTSPPGGAPDGDLPEGACSENEVCVPPPGPGSAPRSAAGAPNPTPPRLLCSTSDPSSGDECTPSHTAFLLFLEFGLRRNTDHPGLDRADLRSAATTVPAAQDGATPGPSLPGEAARYPSPCAGGLATNLQGAADPPMPRRPRGRSSLPGTPRTRQGGARRDGREDATAPPPPTATPLRSHSEDHPAASPPHEAL